MKPQFSSCIEQDPALRTLKSEYIGSTQRGFPFFLAGAIFWLVTIFSYFFVPKTVLPLLWICGIGTVFPLGLVLGKWLKMDLIAKNNPLSTLSGIVGGVQVLFIPVNIYFYLKNPNDLPFVVGVLTGAHFLPYYWIYESKWYLFVSLATVIASILFGLFLGQAPYLWVPTALFLIYLITAWGLRKENRA